MLICISIVDRHREEGDRHVGTYTIEIDYPCSAHPGQMDFKCWDTPPEYEDIIRRGLNQLLTVAQMEALGLEPIQDPVRKAKRDA